MRAGRVAARFVAASSQLWQGDIDPEEAPAQLAMIGAVEIYRRLHLSCSFPVNFEPATSCLLLAASKSKA
jgi:hypothetical protein